jgi:lipid II:glycine glycyltransferase (peptidoglycan interpeptide bridge formation enzyme)
MDWNDEQLVALWQRAIVATAKQRGAVFVRCRPQLFDDDCSQKLFNKLGWREAPMHLHAQLTRQIDLGENEEKLLANMRKNTRYEVRRAEKLSIKITQSTDPADIVAFHALQLETAKRQKFVPFSLEYWQKQFAVFARDNEVVLYSAYHEQELLAQAFIIFYGSEAAYHYGASTAAERKYPGAYAIQWAAIKEAKRRGLKRYNLWGVAPETQKEHRFAALSTFKRGFGGEDIAYLPARDLVIKPVPYFINWVIETTRQKLRKV